MKEEIKKLKKLIDDLDTLALMLDGGFSKESIKSFVSPDKRNDDKEYTVRSMIDCYTNCGDQFTSLFKLIIEKHGNKPIPTRD